MALDPERMTAESEVRNELRECVALARVTEMATAAGERLNAARSAVKLVKAYDRVLERIPLVTLSAVEQKRMRDQLSPVTELLKKYRLR